MAIENTPAKSPTDADTNVLSGFAPPPVTVTPVDPEIAAAQAADARRAAQTAADGSHTPPSIGESPTANPPASKAKATPGEQLGKGLPATVEDGKSVAKETVTPPRTMAQIESDMEATRERLAATLGQLQEAIQPKNIAHRQLEKVKGFYVDEYGAVRPESVAKTVGVVVASVVVVKVLKKIF